MQESNWEIQQVAFELVLLKEIWQMEQFIFSTVNCLEKSNGNMFLWNMALEDYRFYNSGCIRHFQVYHSISLDVNSQSLICIICVVLSFCENMVIF